MNGAIALTGDPAADVGLEDKRRTLFPGNLCRRIFAETSFVFASANFVFLLNGCGAAGKTPTCGVEGVGGRSCSLVSKNCQLLALMRPLLRRQNNFGGCDVAGEAGLIPRPFS
jgi:hypothetical protein